ncbi:signal peptidase I [Streptomyces sp. NPDC048255]|uniref:signal peptidase I n=1 Tax=Streptomyces sp. NPDC048255 TaxID=3154713 RepID=UPI0033D01955
MDDESWWHVLRVAGCRTIVTMVTTLMCLPVAAVAWGWSPSVVVSGSMEPALSRGDVVAVQPVGAHSVGGGAVIAFHDDTHGGRLTTHRAIERQGTTYVTKGDANRGPDTMPVTPDKLEGVVAAVIPWVGVPWLWQEDGRWEYLSAVVLGYALLLRGCRENPLFTR